MTELPEAVYRRQTDFFKMGEFLGKFPAKNVVKKEKNAGKKYRRQNEGGVRSAAGGLWWKRQKGRQKQKMTLHFPSGAAARRVRARPVFSGRRRIFRKKRKKEQKNWHPLRWRKRFYQKKVAGQKTKTEKFQKIPTSALSQPLS